MSAWTAGVPATRVADFVSMEIRGDAQADGLRAKNPLVGDQDVLGLVVRFVGNKAFLPFAGVSTRWRGAWGELPKITCAAWAAESCSCLDWARVCRLDITHRPCQRAAVEGRLDVLELAVAFGYSREAMAICELAAGMGHLEVLKWCRANGFPWGQSCVRAAEGGHLEILEWCWLNGCPWGVERSDTPAPHGPVHTLDRWSWGRVDVSRRTCARVMAAAVRMGELEVVRWCREQGCPWPPQACDMAAKGGHFKLLRLLRAEDCPWSPSTMAAAVESGNPPMLYWCKANGCPWSNNVLHSAAACGNFETRMWCVANRPNGVWDPFVCAAAAAKGQLDVVKWLRCNGCPWGDTVAFSAASGGHFEVLKWCVENGCPWGGSVFHVLHRGFKGSVSMMTWATSNGCPWVSQKPSFDRICDEVAREGNLEVLRWCRARREFSRSVGIALAAASHGHVHVLEWLHAEGCLSNGCDQLCRTAASSGSLKTLKWCRAHGFPWGLYTCTTAARSGKVELLQWCTFNGCPWGRGTAESAAERGDLEMLAWCFMNGCPWNNTLVMDVAWSQGHVEVLAWCRGRGPPWGNEPEAAAQGRYSRLRRLRRPVSGGLPKGFRLSLDEYGQ